MQEFTFNSKIKSAYRWTTIVVLISLIVMSVTMAFFFAGDFASSDIHMSGKVVIEAVGNGTSYNSIEDTSSSCNLEIFLDEDYEVIIPNMPFEMNANCKVKRSTTKPLLRAYISILLKDLSDDSLAVDTFSLTTDLLNQCDEVITGNNWTQFTDGYYYYTGTVSQPSGATGGDLLLQEVDVTSGDVVVDFINSPLRFPYYIDPTYSGFGVYAKIEFQAIQNFIPDENGLQIPNTITNSQLIFSDFDNE